MKPRNALFTCMLALGVVMAAPARAQDALARIIASKTLRVAVPTDYPPYGFVGPDMVPRGIDIEMANIIAAKMGVKVELVPVTGPNRVAYLQSQKADLTISSLGKTPEREKVIDYSIAYTPFFDAIFGAPEVKAKTYEDLKGKTIAVTRGSMQDLELERLAPGAIVSRFEDNSNTLAAFLAGHTQMFATGTTVAAALKQKNPGTGMDLKVILSNSPCYVGVPKGEATLVAKVNQIILEAKRNGVLDDISQRWLGAPAGTLPE
jgi:polar amino acid transport system substrate-binding protein